MTAGDVRGACNRVARAAASVRIDGAALQRLAADMAEDPAPPAWGFPHPRAGEDAPDEAVAGWTLLLSALNFCFWQDEPRWRVGGNDGYMALAHALRRAWDGDATVAAPVTWTRWGVDDLAAVLRGDRGGAALPPMLAERHAVAAELGGWIVAAHGGSALGALATGATAVGFAHILAETCRGFRDVAEYRGGRVPLLKRAQIAAHDCGAALGTRAPARLRDRGGMTAFADYKLPQVLRAAGVLAYAPALAARVDAREELAAGCEEEVEIRACTVVAVDRLTGWLRKAGRDVDEPTVDGMLWWRGQSLQTQPYHRVRTIWY